MAIPMHAGSDEHERMKHEIPDNKLFSEKATEKKKTWRCGETVGQIQQQLIFRYWPPLLFCNNFRIFA